MIIFLLAFGYFLSLPFTAKYKMNSLLGASFLGDRAELIEKTYPELFSKTYGNKAAFLNALNEANAAAADGARARFGLSEADVNQIIFSNAGQPFDLESTARAFEAANKNEQAGKMREWMGWFDGQTFDEASLAPQVQAKADQINAGIQGLSLSGAEKFNITKAASVGMASSNGCLVFFLTFIVGSIGALMHILPKNAELPGIKHNNIWFDSLNSRGTIGIMLGTFLIAFYCVMYWWPAWVAEWALLTDPVASIMTGSASGSQWFLYGLIYTFAVVVMGIRYLIKYRHSRYQQIRTLSVIFFQVAIAFVLANLLELNGLPNTDLKNIWPLDYSLFFDYRIGKLVSEGTIGFWMLGWGIFLFLIGVPLFTYLYGKRWYCSWVCGCGGLAETAGDPFRQHSDKSLKAWKFERWSIHGVLVFAIFMTILVAYTTYWDVFRDSDGQHLLGYGLDSYKVRQWYGFGVSSIFAGVVGTGFYPLMGNRVWCRFGCPLAAYLGIVQRFKSRFRITTNGGQCISCGNCSTYCEQGIDVRWYAQRGQNIVRSSCVGCGVCSAVCPRGVLSLENGPDEARTEIQAIHIGRDEVKILS